MRSLELHLALLALALPVLADPARAQGGETSPVGYVEMPESPDGTWVLTHPSGSGHNWGRPEFVRYLALVAKEWRRRHPDGPVLRIGDMSRPDGSDFPPHKTHKDGLTADLFTTPRNVCHVDYPDQDLSVELARLLHELGARQILYNGAKVVAEVPVAQKYPQHDDHFHVVLDPARMPPGGDAVVLPETAFKDGGWLSRAQLAEDGSGLTLAWRVIGEARVSSWRVVFDDLDDGNGVLHDSGLQRGRRPEYELPLALEAGRRYRWRCELTAGEETLGFPWQGLQVDLTLPEVTLDWPSEEPEVGAPPVLAWRFRKDGAPQESYRIELDLDRSHRKTSGTLGPFAGAATRHALREAPLRPGRRYYWRVLARDAHGNEGASEWASFQTSSSFDLQADPSRVGAAAGEPGAGGGAGAPASGRTGVVTASALNVRAGPSTDQAVVTTLSQGTEVRVLSERAGWYEIEADAGGRPVRGFVSQSYVQVR